MRSQRDGDHHHYTSPPSYNHTAHQYSVSTSSSSSYNPPPRLEPIKWDTSTPVTQVVRQEYNAIADPYCPYTRTKHFKRHMAKQMKLAKLSSEQLSKSTSLDLKTGLVLNNKNDRPTSAPTNKGVTPPTPLPQPTMTISAEPVGNILESESELEVLKTIILREGYLTRLMKIAKKLEKKFKPEIADLLDLVRMASIDVVEAIAEWRRVKGDNHPFFWNGENYFIKMMKDLDYLEQYKVIRKWADFPLTRNPFCVPYPLEIGNQLFTSSVMNPAVDNSATATVVDGFLIGGGSQSQGKPQLSRRKQALISSSVNESSKVSPYRNGSSQAQLAFASSMVPVGIVQSFISNQDMARIRAAEQILIQEEKIYNETHQNVIEVYEEIEKLPLESKSNAKTSIKEKLNTKGQDSDSEEENDVQINMKSQPLPKPRGPSQKKSVRDRLAEITALKEKIAREKMLLEQTGEKEKSKHPSKKVQHLRQEIRAREPLISESTLTPQTPVLTDNEADESISENETEGDNDDTGRKEESQSLDKVSDSFPPPDLDESISSKFEEVSSSPLTSSRRVLHALSERKTSVRQKDHKSKKVRQAILDKAAVKIQAHIRRWRTVRSVISFKKQAILSSILLQRIVRGFCARKRVERALLRKRAAILIQKRARGMNARSMIDAMTKTVRLSRCATIIQKVWRRLLGLSRVSTKKILDQSAKDAMECINVRNLFPMDVKALSNAIFQALTFPQTYSLPPDEVLHLLRLANMLLLGSQTDNTIQDSESHGRDLSWEQAMQLTKRSNRFLRKIRSLAYGPVSKPPRLIVLTPDVISLHRALQFNPKWKLESFEIIGKGAKFCAQLFKWVENMIQVGSAQIKFFDLIGNKLPDWLPRVLAVQQEAHKCEFDIALAERGYSLLQQTIDSLPNDDKNLRMVLEKEKDHLRIESENSQKYLLKLAEKEKEMRDDQTMIEQNSVETMARKLASKDQIVRQVSQEYMALIHAAEQGDTTVEEKLPDIRLRLTSLMAEVRELRIQHGLLVSHVQSNQKRRKARVPLAPDVLVKVNIAAEARALLVIATSKKAVLLLDRGIQSEDQIHRHQEAAVIYKDLCFNETKRLEEYQHLLLEAQKELEIVNQIAYSEITKVREVEKEEKLQFAPSEAELEEDRLEDEKDYKLQRFTRLGFISDAVLSEAPARNRPVLIAFTRDTPGYIKDKIINEITSQLPGMFIQLDITGNLGLNLYQIQAVLDANKSVILTVDHGLTQSSRQTFIDAYSRMCRCLVPRPYSIFAVGDDANGRSDTGDVRFGVSARDMHEMKDADIKTSLEKMSLILRQLLTPDIRKRMEARAQMIDKPSPQYIVCLEALFIAQSDHTRFRMPEDNIAAISYRSTQLLLGDPDGLVSTLRRMKRGKADLKLCDILKTYITHPSWPKFDHPERINDPLLNFLALYVEEWTNSEVLTLSRGGVPDSGLFKNSLDRVQAVVMLCDLTDNDDNLNSIKRSGWKAPLTQILKGVLYEMRVAKTVRKIDDHMHTINVYREAGRVFFDAYDSSTSQSYMAAISLYEIPSLLVPNALTSEMERNSQDVTPPTTSKEMYMKLIRLLKFQKVVKLKAGRKELLCRRENKFIQNTTVRISGHRALLRCFEAALGEIYFEAYLPEFSAKISLEIEDQLRTKMIENYDASLESKVKETDYSIEILPIVLDRLRINPSRRILSTSPTKPSSTSALTTKLANQGFSLHLKCKGGAGRCLTQLVFVFHHIPHIISLRESKESQTLRIISYEPRTQYTSEIRLSRFLRRMILGAVNDNVVSWINILKQKLKLNFKERNDLLIDHVIYRTVRKISKRRLIFSISVVDEISTKFNFFDTVICENFSVVVTKDQILELLHYDHNSTLVDQNVGRFGAFVTAVTDILRYMTGKRSKTITSNHKSIDPSELEIPLEEILSNTQFLEHIADQIEILLERVNPVDIRAGYVLKVPIKLTFTRQTDSVQMKSSNRLKPLNTILRHTPRLVQKQRGGTVEDVIACRRQPPVVNMEESLNELAAFQAEIARLKALEEKIAADRLNQRLLLGDDSKSQSRAPTAPHTNAPSEKDDQSEIQGTQTPRFSTRPPSEYNPLSPEISIGGEDISPSSPVYSVPKSKFQPTRYDAAEEKEDNRRFGEEQLVFDRGVKCNFREDKEKNRWHSHVKATVYETLVWDGEEIVDRILRFVVYESKTSLSYEGVIRSIKHLREVLGHGGIDLISQDKSMEMILYIARRRLEMVRNTTSWDGEPVTDPNAPPYRVEFMSDRVYNVTKITPAYAGGEKDLKANADKLIDQGEIRGKKLLRVAKRINGLLLQIVVFELPSTDPKSAKQKKENHGSGDSSVHSGAHSSSLISDDSSSIKKKKDPIECHPPPLVRVVGYDPRSKKNSTLEVCKEAVVEVAGGSYSQYLEPPRRKELAKIIVDALAVHFPRGGGFDLLLPWSGSNVKASNVQASTKASWRSSAEKILKRTGKIFRSALRISSFDIIVSVYAVGLASDGTMSSDRSVIMNFYSSKCSEATEIQIPEEVQMEYIGKVFMNLPAGEPRADAIRQFCQFLRADIAEDPGDPTLKVLEVDLQAKEKEKNESSQGISEPIGKVLYRQKTAIYLEETGQLSPDDYMLTLSNRSLNEADGPEKGVLARIYEPDSNQTLALTYDGEDIQELCSKFDEPDLLRDLLTARRYVNDLSEKNKSNDDFVTEIEKVEWTSKIRIYNSMICDYLVKDIGLMRSSGSGTNSPLLGKKPQVSVVKLYSRMKEGKKGIF